MPSDMAGFPLALRVLNAPDTRGLLQGFSAGVSDERGLVGPGLLDPYAGLLWGAFGLSRLLGNYAGPCLRVRRDYDNAERDIGFVDSVLDVASLTFFTGGSSNVYVVKWYDQSGAANDASQSSNAAQPKIIDAGAYYGELLFDGVDDFLATTAATPNTIDKVTLYLAGRERRPPQSSGQATSRLVIGSTVGGLYLLHDPAGGQDTYFGELSNTQGGANFFDDEFTRSHRTYAAAYDLAQASVAGECLLFIDGVNATSDHTSGGTASGNFSASTWYFGALSPGTSEFSRLAVSTALIYSGVAHPTTTISAISALIQPPRKVDGLRGFLTNLWMAGGLRRIVPFYSGALIRVRRSSDSTESDIGQDEFGFVSQAQLLSFCGSGSGFVTKVYDQSGGGNDAVQATAGNQPRIWNSGVYDAQGIRFDGTDDFIATPNTSAVSAFTVFLQANFENTATAVGLEQSTNWNTQTGAVINFSGTQFQCGLTQTSSANKSSSFFNTNDVGQIVTCRLDRTQATRATQAAMFNGGILLTRDGNADAGSLPAGNFQAVPWFIGARSGGSGATRMDLEVIAIYSAALTDASIGSISPALG